MLNLLLSELIITLESISSVTLFNAFLKHRFQRFPKAQNALFTVNLLLLANIISIVWMVNLRPKIVIFIIIYCLLVSLFYSGPYAVKLFLAVIFYVIDCMLDYYIVLLANLTEIPFKMALCSIISKMTLLFLMMIISKRFTTKIFRYLTSRAIKTLLIFALFTLILLELLFSLPLNNTTLCVSTCILTMSVIVLVLMHDLLSENSKMFTDEYRKKTANDVLRNIHLSSKAEKIQHDFCNHLICLENYIGQNENEKALSYIHSLMKPLRAVPKIETDDGCIIYRLLNYKMAEAIEKDIALVTSIGDLSQFNLPDEDITVILGNLLDNAIEACEQITGTRIIKLKLEADEDILISIHNTVAHKVKIIDNRIATTKGRKSEHGFGLLSVQEVLEKYDSMYDITCDEEYFHVTILIQANFAKK